MRMRWLIVSRKKAWVVCPSLKFCGDGINIFRVVHTGVSVTSGASVARCLSERSLSDSDLMGRWESTTKEVRKAMDIQFIGDERQSYVTDGDCQHYHSVVDGVVEMVLQKDFVLGDFKEIKLNSMAI
ncbi:hypothetical protein V6N11_061905 [Hibiscus sabdariffa]|uniref:Uncharacterized protein n=1 Tax=Hibiscus sabdariffa TaxID=183260 RepID=A0ABR2N7L8_9ROSI